MGLQGCQKKDSLSGDLFVFRDLHQFVLHYLSRCAHALTALISYRNKLTKLLERLRVKLANGLTYFFVTHTITQTNVHKNSRSIYDQSVSENNYDYNSTCVERRAGSEQKMRIIVTGNKFKKQKRAPKRPFLFKTN
jgi:hypothetical protein